MCDCTVSFLWRVFVDMSYEMIAAIALGGAAGLCVRWVASRRRARRMTAAIRRAVRWMEADEIRQQWESAGHENL